MTYGTLHIIENCPKCRGTHVGSYECPIFCIACASGNDLPEGEECKVCGRIGRPLHVERGLTADEAVVEAITGIVLK